MRTTLLQSGELQRSPSLWSGLLTVLNSKWLFVLLATAVVLAGPSYSGIFHEDLQTLLFPLVLVAFSYLFRAKNHRIPTILLVVAAGCWLVGAADRRGLLSGAVGIANIQLSRLEGDRDGLGGRKIYFRYNQIATTYGLPKMKIIQSSFESDSQARAWVSKQNPGSILLTGTLNWLHVWMNYDRSFFPKIDLEKITANEFFVEQAALIGVKLGRESRVVASQHFGYPLIVSFPPDEFQLPTEPRELSLHFLSWFFDGVKGEYDVSQKFTSLGIPLTDALPEPEKISAIQKNALLSAYLYNGPWKTAEPRAIALSIVGLHHLAAALNGKSLDDGELECALFWFSSAARYVQESKAPEIYAKIFNNAAVTEILAGNRQPNYKKAMSWLWMASTARNREGHLVEGAREAYLNLNMMLKAGIVPAKP